MKRLLLGTFAVCALGIVALHAWVKSPCGNPATIVPQKLSGVPQPTPISSQQLGAIWTLTGALPSPIKPTTSNYPLSDQGNLGGWTPNPQMSDEFEGGILDTTKWVSGPLVCTADGSTGPWNGRQPSLYLPANAKVGVGPSGTGNLQITIAKDPGNPAFTPALTAQGYHTYTTGLAHTIARGGNGYYEIKAKIAKANVDNAFWFQQEDQTLYPGCATEIDIFELTGTGLGYVNQPASVPPYYQWDFMTTHVFQYPGKTTGWSTDWHQGYWWIGNIPFRDDYHVFGFERNDNTLTWYVDGVKVQTLQNIYFHQPQWLIFDIETAPAWFGLPADTELPAVYNVEYVRSWTRGTVQKTPILTVSKDLNVQLGTPLTNLVTANVPGAFSYKPTVVWSYGPATISVSFTPTDNVTYTAVGTTITVIGVAPKTNPVVTWNHPASIVQGTALNAVQLDATANVPGAFFYNPAIGVVLPTGATTLWVSFTPTDTATYNTVTTAVPLVVKAPSGKITPVLTVGSNLNVPIGKALSTLGLVTANVPGTFVYTPGTIWPYGPATVTVAFTPTDTTKYESVTTTINVTGVTP